VRRLSLIIILRSINFIFPLIIVNVVRVKGTFILLRVFIYLVFLIDVEIKLVEIDVEIKLVEICCKYLVDAAVIFLLEF
jgi:hypothetical protein